LKKKNFKNADKKSLVASKGRGRWNSLRNRELDELKEKVHQSPFKKKKKRGDVHQGDPTRRNTNGKESTRKKGKGSSAGRLPKKTRRGGPEHLRDRQRTIQEVCSKKMCRKGKGRKKCQNTSGRKEKTRSRTPSTAWHRQKGEG